MRFPCNQITAQSDRPAAESVFGSDRNTGFHFATHLDEWVDGLLTGGGGTRGREPAARLRAAG